MVHPGWSCVCAGLVLSSAALPAQLTWRQAGAQPPGRCSHFAFFDEPHGRITVFQGQDTPTSYINDCWQLEGDDWIQASAATAITPPRAFGAACEDVSGGGLVFGGADNSGTIFGETLRYDPQSLQFSRLAPATSPPARWATAMAFDSARRRVVLFGGGSVAGYLNDTWEWDGSTWAQRFPAQSPGPRSGHVMAFDEVRGRVVLHGGGSASILSDTWTYDGTTWTNVSPATGPGAIFNAAMAYDATRGVTVLFGGQDGGFLVNGNTWEWNGATWTTRPAGPSARKFASLTYDKQRRRVTLIAGQDEAGTRLRDAWTWDGIGWQQRAPRSIVSSSLPPQERAYQAAAYDSNRGRLVAFAGNTANATGVLNDTVESDGFAWTRRTPANPPSGRTLARMAFDPNQGRCYMFGGRGVSTFTDNLLWLWSGNNWTSTIGGATPPWARYGHDIVYDGDRRKLVVFGGVTAVFLQPENDTWEYDATTGWAQRSPATSPSRRYQHAMAWHAGDHGTYLFGGSRPVGGLSDELWFWDGTDWTFLLPSSRPPALADAAMCYDAGRNRLVLFGGWNGFAYRRDVYEYNGTNWAIRPPLSSERPDARAGASLVYDTKNHRCVLFGGMAGTPYFNDVWEWDGTAQIWSRRPHAGVPEARGDHAMSHDPVRRRTVLFGGNQYNGRLCDDTWEWNGSTWTPSVAVRAPAPRFTMAMAFDAAWGETVLFGGWDGSTALGDTWIYDGTRWATPLENPLNSPRANHAMASLWPAPGVILHGGHNGINPLGGTYRWDLSGWTLVANGFGPGARDIHAMAYDRIRRKVVLFGGRDQSQSFLNDTWEFDVGLSTWLLVIPPTTPPGRWNHAMTFDAARGRVVMTGGYNGAYLNDVWEWTGSDWLQRSPETVRPPAVENSGFAYDPSRTRCVWFGGNGSGVNGELWELSSPVDFAGSGQQTNSLPLLYLSQPAIGRTFTVSFDNTRSGILLLDVGPVQGPRLTVPPGVTCTTANLFAANVFFAFPAPPGPFPLPVPNDASLLLQTLVFQGMALQPQACMRMTDALHVTIRSP